MVDLSAFHPGDKVKVVDKAVPDSYIIPGTMSGFLGKIVTIQSIKTYPYEAASYAKIEEDGGRYNWGPRLLSMSVTTKRPLMLLRWKTSLPPSPPSAIKEGREAEWLISERFSQATW